MISVKVKYGGYYGSEYEIGHHSAYDVAARAIIGAAPKLNEKLEESWSEFSSGEITLTCRNDTKWWNNIFDSTSHFARYPDCVSVTFYRETGEVWWEGDVDILSVNYNEKEETVTFAVNGKMKRLERFDASGIVRSFPRFADFGYTTLTGSGWLQDTTKLWPVNRFKNHVLIDGAATPNVRQIISNTSNQLTLSGSGTPTTGHYRIRPTYWAHVGTITEAGGVYTQPNPRKLTSTIPVGDVNGLGLRVGDIIRFVNFSQGVMRVNNKYAYMARPFEAWSNDYTIASVGPTPVGWPSSTALTSYQVFIDEDLVPFTDSAGVHRVFSPGDAGILLTPYHKNRTLSDVVTMCFNACGIANGNEVSGFKFPEYVPLGAQNGMFYLDLPNESEFGSIPYADFEGKNGLEALKALAAISGCVVGSTPTRYVFVRREAATSSPSAMSSTTGSSGTGFMGSLDHCLLSKKTIQQHEHSFDHVTVEGADGRKVTRGQVDKPGQGLEISSPMIGTFDSVNSVATRLWTILGGRRKGATATFRPEAHPNLVVDSSFEGELALGGNWQGQWVDGVNSRWIWNAAPNNSTSFVQRVDNTGNEYVISGKKSLVIQCLDGLPSGVGVRQQLFGWDVGDKLRLSAAVRFYEYTRGNLVVDIVAKDSSQAIIGGTPILAWNTYGGGAIARKVYAEYTVPSNCFTLQVRIYGNNTPVYTAYIDDVNVLRTNLKIRPSVLAATSIGDTEYIVTECTQELGSEDVVGATEVNLMARVGQAPAVESVAIGESTMPAPPTITSVTAWQVDTSEPADGVANYTVFQVTMSWPYADQEPNIGFALGNVWLRDSAAGRQDSAVISMNYFKKVAAGVYEAAFNLVPAGTATANKYLIDVQLVFFDGRLTAPSLPFLVPSITGL